MYFSNYCFEVICIPQSVRIYVLKRNLEKSWQFAKVFDEYRGGHLVLLCKSKIYAFHFLGFES